LDDSTLLKGVRLVVQFASGGISIQSGGNGVAEGRVVGPGVLDWLKLIWASSGQKFLLTHEFISHLQMVQVALDTLARKRPGKLVQLRPLQCSDKQHYPSP
jgi:hypothetical protein